MEHFDAVAHLVVGVVRVVVVHKVRFEDVHLHPHIPDLDSRQDHVVRFVVRCPGGCQKSGSRPGHELGRVVLRPVTRGRGCVDADVAGWISDSEIGLVVVGIEEISPSIFFVRHDGDLRGCTLAVTPPPVLPEEDAAFTVRVAVGRPAFEKVADPVR